MSTKPQRKRRTRSQREEDGKTMAGAVTSLMATMQARERKRLRKFWAAVWVAIVFSAVLGVVF